MFNNNQIPEKSNEIELGKVLPLSTAHIRPFSGSDDSKRPVIQYVQGASLLRSNKNRPCPAVGGGARGGIKGFSKQSRKRLLELIACVQREAELPCFVTLTYPEYYPDVFKAKRDLKVFNQRLMRRFPSAGAIWKLEPQQRGAPHFHLLVWGVHQVDLFSWVVNNWYEIAGNGDVNHLRFHAGLIPGTQKCVQKVRSWRGVWSYAAKYLGKTFEVAEWGNLWTGRFWGVLARENIPFGEVQEIEVPYREVVQVMRYQRRFMNIRTGKDKNSMKCFCDVDQWINRIIEVPGQRGTQGGDLGGPSPAMGATGGTLGDLARSSR